jgi:hypothetical protein
MKQAGTIVVAAAAVFLLAGCGGDRQSSASAGSGKAEGSTNSPSAVRYSRCMRSHGVPSFPDPDSSGSIPKGDAQSLGVSTSGYEAAETACRHLLPTGGSFEQGALQCTLAADCPPAVVQQMTSAMTKFARCMRSHGVPNWPDPTLDPQGRPVFAISAGRDGFDPDSPQITGTDQECVRLTGQHTDASGHGPGVDGPRAVSR